MRKRAWIVIIGLLILIGLRISFEKMTSGLIKIYGKNQSYEVYDRNGKEIALLQNPKKEYASYRNDYPAKLKKTVIQKEDKYFYFHPGINPFSTLRGLLAGLDFLNLGRGSSTIHQQLAKILLNHISNRSVRNKLEESFYALALNSVLKKEEILNMYLNSVYLGNNISGFEEASRYYFGVSSSLLTDGQIMQLVQTISEPNTANPLKEKNIEITKLWLKNDFAKSLTTDYIQVKKFTVSRFRSNPAMFELRQRINVADNKKTYDRKYLHELNQAKKIVVTLDLDLNNKIREVVSESLNSLSRKNVNNGAVVVIKLPSNEVLTLVGSPEPDSLAPGYQIDMTNAPRKIGSTAKPFIYVLGFAKGLRPYTLVDDREYRYETYYGFPFYPKNFDYSYRGIITLHYALSNSLNVPSVKVLEYIGLDQFAEFVSQLGYKKSNDLRNIQLGAALGIMEDNLYDLCRMYTIFPNGGLLKPLIINKNEVGPSQKLVIDEKYTAIINLILSDRITGVEQFGLKSDLNLPYNNYALKTGTSQDFKDSWVVGYTPDFLVGVWVGNADETPSEGVSGQAGAGTIWTRVMEIIYKILYNRNSVFNLTKTAVYQINGILEYGLKGDNLEKIQQLLLDKSASLILHPFNNDRFLIEGLNGISLKASNQVDWYVNGQKVGQGKEVVFTPKKTGRYKIKATGKEKQEEIEIEVL
jgi:membrane carboxypeptidase/penicillin-binding protein PbpC